MHAMIYWPWFLSMRGKVMSSLLCFPLLDFLVTPVVVGFEKQEQIKLLDGAFLFLFNLI